MICVAIILLSLLNDSFQGAQIILEAIVSTEAKITLCQKENKV